jgi:hypothetical protein
VKTTTNLTTLHEQAPIATCPIDRKNQILLTSKSPDEITSGLLFAMHTHKSKESGGRKRKTPLTISTPSCPTRGTAPFPTKPRIPTANTRIECQKNKPQTFIEQTEHFAVAVLFFFFLYS